MCGIVGYLGQQQAWPIIFEGLQRLEYRGYDSAGIVIINSDRQFQFRKTVGKVSGLNSGNNQNWPVGSVGIGHTRWATHGRPSESNAHPHTDCHHQIAVVHNGIVENYLELKGSLVSRGHQFSSETDTSETAGPFARTPNLPSPMQIGQMPTPFSAKTRRPSKILTERLS